jgi:geranylgeranyl pyrophosphate synthase
MFKSLLVLIIIYFTLGVSATESLGAFEYGKHVGIAFQLVDDLLDFVSSADQLGVVLTEGEYSSRKKGRKK